MFVLLLCLSLAADGCSAQTAKNPVLKVKNPDAKLAARAVNRFALDLYADLAKDGGGNLFFSPYSIGAALAMAQAGARGATAADMAKALYFEKDPAQMQAGHGALSILMQDAGNAKDQELLIANAVWLQKELALLDSYRAVVRDDFRAELQRADFKQAVEAAGAINGWVGQKNPRPDP